MSRNGPPNYNELKGEVFSCLGRSGLLGWVVSDILKRSKYPEPNANKILQKSLIADPIIRQESDILKILLCIEQVRKSICDVINFEREYIVDYVLEDYKYVNEKIRQRLIDELAGEKVLEWIESMRVKSRSNMVLFDSENEDDDKNDMQVFIGKASKLYITPENNCFHIRHIGEKYEFKFIELIQIKHPNAQDKQEIDTYCIVEYEGGTQGLISLESGINLPIEEMIYLKYGSDVGDRISINPGIKKDAYIIEVASDKKIGYTTAHGNPMSWTPVDEVIAFSTHPKPGLLKRTVKNTIIVIPINT